MYQKLVKIILSDKTNLC